jgi:hypothetical protein
MRWAGHVACMGNRKGAYRILVRTPEVKNHFECLGVEGIMILKRIFNKWYGIRSNAVTNPLVP